MRALKTCDNGDGAVAWEIVRCIAAERKLASSASHNTDSERVSWELKRLEKLGSVVYTGAAWKISGK